MNRLKDSFMYYLGVYGDSVAWSIAGLVILWDFILYGVTRGFIEAGIGLIGMLSLLVAVCIKIAANYINRHPW